MPEKIKEPKYVIIPLRPVEYVALCLCGRRLTMTHIRVRRECPRCYRPLGASPRPFPHKREADRYWRQWSRRL